MQLNGSRSRPRRSSPCRSWRCIIPASRPGGTAVKQRAAAARIGAGARFGRRDLCARADRVVAPSARLRRRDGRGLWASATRRWSSTTARSPPSDLPSRRRRTLSSSPPAGFGTRARTSRRSIAAAAAARRAGARRRTAEGPNGARSSLRHLQRARRAAPSARCARRLARTADLRFAGAYEPFGLAVLEAAQAGCALLLSDIPTFRELWDGAALFVAAATIARASPSRASDALLADPATRRGLGGAAARASGARYGAADARWRDDIAGARTDAHAAAYARRSREQRREDRLLHPFARLLLEPRQRAFPARRAARVDPRRP